MLRREAFYPLPPAGIAQHLSPWDEARDAPQWAVIAEHAVAVHYWNALSGGRRLSCGSLLHRLLEANCVVCTTLPCDA